MYGLWTSCLILVMTYPGYLVWKPPGGFPLAGLVKSIYHSILFVLVQIPALTRKMSSKSATLITLTWFYWVGFFVAMFVKIKFFLPLEMAMAKASL
jgi:hypothetical protein